MLNDAALTALLADRQRFLLVSGGGSICLRAELETRIAAVQRSEGSYCIVPASIASTLNKGLMAQAWDVLRGDTSKWSDRFFYLELIERFGQPVLDVGCGTGRLLLDYLAQGIDIVHASPSLQLIWFASPPSPCWNTNGMPWPVSR